MATVITNLLSAIPFIGGDIVPFIFIFIFYNVLYFYTSQIYYSINNIKENNQSFSKKENSTSKTQILFDSINKDLLSLIVGFIDGDGYFRITKKTKLSSNKDYITIALIINLNENDTKLLEYFYDNLKIGKIYKVKSKIGNNLIR
jgi:hypothetical protein